MKGKSENVTKNTLHFLPIFFLSVFHVTHLPRRREIRLELKGEDCVLKDLVIVKGQLRKLQKSMMHMQL